MTIAVYANKRINEFIQRLLLKPKYFNGEWIFMNFFVNFHHFGQFLTILVNFIKISEL